VARSLVLGGSFRPLLRQPWLAGESVQPARPRAHAEGS